MAAVLLNVLMPSVNNMARSDLHPGGGPRLQERDVLGKKDAPDFLRNARRI